MNRFTISSRFSHHDDCVVIRLRKSGFSAWCETDNGRAVLITDATRAAVAIEAGHGQFLAVAETPLETLHSVYTRASNPSERFADLFSAVDSVFAPLSASDSRSLAKAFGIAVSCRSKRAALVAVRQRIEGRLESAQRCRF